MDKLPENFEKDALDLLVPISTEGTLKNRRNLLVSSFIIISIYVLDKSLSTLKVFGLNLENSRPEIVIGIAITLIFFWLVVFLIHFRKDSELNKERVYLLRKKLDSFTEKLVRFRSNYGHHDNSHPNKTTLNNLEREYNIYTKQQERTKWAKRLAITGAIIDFGMPLMLAIVALFFLFKDLMSVL